MGAKLNHSVNEGHGPYVFQINGNCHYLMGSLLPTEENPGGLLQSNYKLRLIGKRDNDSQQYNDPSSNDIGGLIVGDIGNFHFERDIIIEQCYGSLEKISKLHPKFMALQYPLLFPYGDDGYRCNIMFVNQDHQLQRKCSRVPMRAFYAYLIHERANIENIVIKGGRLYQQFLVDAFVNVEKDRLDYIRANQKDVDSIVSAEIPCKITDPICYNIVSKFMIHGPYGLPNQKSKCMNKGKCSKSFPKQFRATTIFDDNGFVYYKRHHQHDNFVLKDGIQLHKNYVVPYNRELLLRYNVHINVEICCQSMLIKYLFKYVSKRSDRCRMVVQKDNDDEIKAYLNCRFICPYEAAKKVVHRNKGFQPWSSDICSSCSRGIVFSKLLLSHVKGALSFDDLKKVSRILYLTFQLACKSLGLLGDDKEWEDALSEAIITATSLQIRQLFVSLVLFYEVNDPNELFLQFWRSMHDDVIQRFRSTLNMPNLLMFDDELRNYVLYELELLFNVASTSLGKYKLLMPNERLLAKIRNKLLREELTYDIVDLKSQHSTAFPLLNQCQGHIYENVITVVMDKKTSFNFCPWT
uniref:Helitron helicase-like domain-containing protein n=1 Tax=Salix viminalis TaxID=40686 RepID=A0A6N2LNR1_SALVM